MPQLNFDIVLANNGAGDRFPQQLAKAGAKPTGYIRVTYATRIQPGWFVRSKHSLASCQFPSWEVSGWVQHQRHVRFP